MIRQKISSAARFVKPILSAAFIALAVSNTSLSLAANADGKTPGYNTLRNPYFGQTHLHSGWSFDEAIYNVTLGPDNAYKHARGDKVKHPSGYDV
jgi:hypothetical protein